MASKPTYQELVNQIAELKKQNEVFQLQFSSLEEGKVLNYNTILNNMGDPVFIKDDKSRLLIVNDAFCELFNLERDHIIGKTLAEDVSTEERESFLKIDKLVLESGVENINEESLTVHGGQTKIISTRKTRYIDSDGNKFLVGVIRDITERKKAEEETKKSEERLKIVFDNSPFPIAVVDEKDQNITYWSKSALQLFGHDPKTTEEWYELAYPNPEFRKEVIERWKPFLETAQNSTEAVNTGEYEITCKNGSVKICELYAQFIPGSLIVTLNDITERKNEEEHLKALNQQLQASEQQIRAANQQLQANEQQLEAANQQLSASEQELQALVQQLRANEQQLRAANQQLLEAKEKADRYLNVAAEIIISLDKKGCISLLNDSGHQLLGFKKGQLIGKNWFTHCLPENNVKEIKAVFQKLMNGQIEEVANYESDIKTKSGEIKTILWHNTILHDEKGKINGLLSSGEDITYIKNAEIELKQSDRVFNLSLDMFCIAGFNGYFKYLNPAWERTLGWSIEELLSKPWLDFVHPDDAEKTENAKSVIVDGKEIYQFENRYICKNGSVVWLSWNSQPFPEENIMIGAVRDITESKKIENELLGAKEKAEESEKQLKLIADNFVNGMIYQVAMLDENRRKFNYVSENVNELYGCTVEEAKENADLIYGKLHPDDIDGIIEKEKEALINMSIFETEARTIKPNGDIRWAYYISKPRIIDGIVCWDGIEVDITERKQMELELLKAKEKAEESEEKLRIIFENGTNVIYSHTVDHIVSYVSPQIENLLGYTPEEAKKKWTKFTSENPINKIGYEHTFKAIETGKSQPVYELELIHKNGQKVLVEVHESPVVKNGKTVSIVGAFNDITERKLAEEALKDSEEKLRNIFENGTNVLYSHTLEHQITYISPQIENLLGYTPEEAEKKWTEFASESPINKIGIKNTLKAIETGKSQPLYELELIHKNGKKIFVEVRESPVVENGKTVSIVGALSDITERKLAEQELLKAKEKAEESDRLKSAFLANMSHEIRTPMNGILGFTDLLKEPQLTGPERKKYIRIIENSGQRLLNTVNDLIDISKIEAGQMKVSISEFDINQLNEELFTFFNEEARKKELQLLLSHAPIKNSSILSDKEKIYAILTNLIKNAIKYTQKGSIEFGYDVKDNHMQFFVKDTGDGISKERLDAIFDRFIRGDKDEEIFTEGSGLGLSISKAYVEMLGGKIWLESEVGIGSKFYFTIPYKSVKGRINETTTVDKKSTNEIDHKVSGLKILIAEDDEAAESLISVIVKNISKEILQSKNGDETVKLCRKNPDIDVILMDIRMPGMNGYDATRQIREFNKDVVIIAQTAFAIAGDREKSLEAGCNDYISKPIKKEELLEKIEKCVSRQ